MKILLAQINPIVGDLKGNSEYILKILREYKADLYVFPELSLLGYIPQDLLLKRKFIDANILALKNIVRYTMNKSMVIGFVDRIEERLFNSSALISNASLIGVYHKQCLPNYDVFDEKRWFTPGKDIGVFKLMDKVIGINICEDIWFKSPTENQIITGAELIINISASPYSINKIKKIERIVMQRYSESELPIVYVNQVGSQDGIVFYGHSMFVNNGKILACKDFEEEIKIVEVE